MSLVTTERPSDEVRAENADVDAARRDELAHFLRRRREAISPAQVGLQVGGRRRTPGLRREEVAQLAAVGVTWYTWLEQARDIRVSENVLEALTRALMLDAHERAHLFNLAGAPSAAAAIESDTLDPAVGLMLERFGTYPAAVMNARYDVLAFNPAYAALIGDVAAIPFDQRNILWLMFTSARMRTLLVEWEHATRRCVAQLRASYADHMTEPAWRSLVQRLQAASPTFGTWWEEHQVAAMTNIVKQFRHPDLGLLRFNATNMWLAQTVGNRMMVFTPADEATESIHAQLADMQPPALYD